MEKALTGPCGSHQTRLHLVSIRRATRSGGEPEMRSAKAAVARAGLGALEKDAASKGFLLIARRAHTTSAPREGFPPPQLRDWLFKRADPRFKESTIDSQSSR